MPEESKDPLRIEQLQIAWQAFAAQICEALRAREPQSPGPCRSAHPDILALGRECADLGLQIQLWALDAGVPRAKASVTPMIGGWRKSERTDRARRQRTTSASPPGPRG